jgi:hydroxymethylglutaryl-CoA lyase
MSSWCHAGIKPFIPTERKVAYIQSLLRVGFDSIDFETVSPKAIPQMQDTAAV